ncbi:MAG: hypothetical protein AB8I08_01690 [Sandaracinaceae bacterium]
MTWLRHALAHAAVLTTLLGGCALSHGLDGERRDAGPFDAGPFDAGRPDAGRPDSGRPDSGRPDAGRPDSGVVDGGFVDSGVVDGGVVDGGAPSCDPQDAAEEPCNDVVCDALDSWYWDGGTCNPVSCGTCVGDDCGLGYGSLEECEAVHSTCAAQLCTDTGGEWRWWDEVCGHYTCGFRAPDSCEVGQPACDCGLNQTFEPGVGCIDVDCPDVDIDREVLCTTTGGSWDDICCDTVCGEYCADACIAPACACAADEVFHPVRGCERGLACMERNVGQSCTPDARCEAGSLCCDTCGGAGCAGTPMCRLPTCSGDVDLCGNNPDAP